jgi:hypothetical protein
LIKAFGRPCLVKTALPVKKFLTSDPVRTCWFAKTEKADDRKPVQKPHRELNTTAIKQADEGNGIACVIHGKLDKKWPGPH